MRARERHDERARAAGARDLEPLDRAEHGDRRRDHPVAVEQRRADDDQERRRRRSARLARSRPGTSASSARMPPSPRLSARMTKVGYLTDTTSVSAQTMSETTPKTSSGPAPCPLGARAGTPGACRAGSCRCRRRRRRWRRRPRRGPCPTQRSRADLGLDVDPRRHRSGGGVHPRLGVPDRPRCHRESLAASSHLL